MTLAVPLPLADFLAGLRVASVTFELGEAVESLTLGGGEVLTVQHGTRLWGGTVTLATAGHAEHEAVMAVVRALQRPGASFLATPLHRPAVGVAAGTLNGVQGAREVRFAGLAAGAARPVGAFFSFVYLDNPLRYALHQLVQAATASGAGVTGWAECVPPVRPGFAVGAAVAFERPRAKAVMVPRSLRAASIGPRRALGVAFDWTQTLR